MIPWEAIDRATTPDGTELSLHRRGHEWVIRDGGQDLMSNRMHGSEEEMARRARATRPGARVLVGGLGMGYTLRAALDALPRGGTCVVGELSEAVVAWNRGPLGELAGHPLQDPRVTLALGDIADTLWQATTPWDVVLLDVDNGPDPLTQTGNDSLYDLTGLFRTLHALRPGGVLAVWSAYDSPAFAKRMRSAGFNVEVAQVRARAEGKGPRHFLFFGTRPGGAKPAAPGADGGRPPRRPGGDQTYKNTRRRFG